MEPVDEGNNIQYMHYDCHKANEQKVSSQDIYINGHAKVPFPFGEGQGREWMWLNIISVDHKKKKITGVLDNYPRHATTFKFGEKYDAKISDIYQYIPPGSD